MNVREMIVAVRDDYVEQLSDFIAAERSSDPAVFVERRIAAPQSGLFARSYVADVSFGDPVTRMSDFVPRERAGTLPSFSLDTPTIKVAFDDLWWNNARIDHNGKYEGQRLSLWFDRWFPSLDPAKPRAPEVEGYIHSVSVDEKWISVDFGSATIGALFELLSVTQRCGATEAVVTRGEMIPIAQ